MLTPILYMIIGFSLGVGLALIYLQEKFTRERRKLLGLNEAEKAKSAEMLASLDAKWEEKNKTDKAEGSAQATRVQELQRALKVAEEKVFEHATEPLSRNDTDNQASELQEILTGKETELEELLSEKQNISSTLNAARQEVEELQGEIIFLKGEIKTLKEEKKREPIDDDYLVLGPGNHYIPGSVARALMERSKK